MQRAFDEAAETYQRGELMEGISTERVEELASAEREGKIRIGCDWTPCAEGLPPNSGMYEVTWQSKRDGKLFCGHATFYAIKKRWDEENEGYSVVAWIPKRQEPYRADDTTGKVDHFVDNMGQVGDVSKWPDWKRRAALSNYEFGKED